MTGFVRKSTAPAFIALTLVETSPRPVKKMMGRWEPDSGQGFLQTQAIELRHYEVDDRAAGNGRIVGGEEFLWRRKGFGLVSAGLQEPRHRPKDGRIVVDQIGYKARVVHHSHTPHDGKDYLNPAAAEAEKPRSRPLSHYFEARACRHEA